jgi:hypothetical protein
MSHCRCCFRSATAAAAAAAVDSGAHRQLLPHSPSCCQRLLLLLLTAQLSSGSLTRTQHLQDDSHSSATLNKHQLGCVATLNKHQLGCVALSFIMLDSIATRQQGKRRKPWWCRIRRDTATNTPAQSHCKHKTQSRQWKLQIACIPPTSVAFPLAAAAAHVLSCLLLLPVCLLLLLLLGLAELEHVGKLTAAAHNSTH